VSFGKTCTNFSQACCFLLQSRGIALFQFRWVGWVGVRLSPFGTSVINWPIVPAPDDRWVGSSRWNENCQGQPEIFGGNLLQCTHCPLQIPHDLTRDRTRVAEVVRRRLNAWAMAQQRVEEKEPLLYPEDGRSMHISNVGSFLPDYTGWHPTTVILVFSSARFSNPI
jgi:hypothetical protein